MIAAYGADKSLQEIANLVIVAGTRDDIRDMEESQQKILSDMLMDIDRYDLWGKIAIPKHLHPEDVPELYRMAVRRRGIFANPALTEPFGLTLIEAAASGLPIVATEDGGPRDIIGNCNNGILVNPLDQQAITDAFNLALVRQGNSGVTGRKVVWWVCAIITPGNCPYRCVYEGGASVAAS